MLSLDKTKSEEDVVKFLEGYDGIAMAKMDGLTCSLWYKDGNLVSAETRGNGYIGEDVTHNIITVEGVPLEIPIKDEVIIDGEIICKYANFKPFENEYANPRNFAAGSIRLLSSEICASRHLSFIAWDCIKGLDCPTLSEKLFILNNWGFLFVPYIPFLSNMINLDHIKHTIILLKENAKEFGYPIDGLVFKFNDCEYYQSLGYTGHHFRGGLAFKFYDEEYESELLNIEYTMGKTGILTPVAVFTPIDTGDNIIERASLHNLNIMKQILGEHPYKGQKIWVIKTNMIIPQIVRSIPWEKLDKNN
jgi:DNA ligase (NAD+)